MMSFERHIQDSVHGYIGITPAETELIDTPVFQRLRHIHHLGLGDFVYPAATHSRFAHSLGSMFVMDQIANHLITTGQVSIGKDELQKLRFAALLHDVGHYPFSHVIEGVMKERHSDNGRHEALTERVIRETQIAGILKKAGQDPEEIASMVRAKHKNKLYNFLLSSDFDVDRVDYLLRDALHTGVAYGYIDVNRLLRTMTVDKETARLAVLQKGRQAMENFLIGRYHMYQTVYYHKTVAAFELMLKRVYSQLIEESILPDLIEVFQNEDQFSKYDDHFVWLKLSGYAGANANLRELVDMLRRRRPIKVVSEEASLSADKDTIAKQSKLLLLQIPRQLRMLAEASGVESDWIFLVQPPSIHVMKSSEEETGILVEKNGNFIPLIEDRTSIISLLGDSVYLSPRVYTRNDEYRKKVRQGLMECFGI